MTLLPRDHTITGLLAVLDSRDSGGGRLELSAADRNTDGMTAILRHPVKVVSPHHDDGGVPAG
ncbi:MAG: hypothetical protein CSB46_06820 [Micrococcales bacterium]|nr:MAG: hypothetical protein CSB46_06820 [Micrococcales bacterium]